MPQKKLSAEVDGQKTKPQKKPLAAVIGEKKKTQAKSAKELINSNGEEVIGVKKKPRKKHVHSKPLARNHCGYEEEYIGDTLEVIGDADAMVNIYGEVFTKFSRKPSKKLIKGHR